MLPIQLEPNMDIGQALAMMQYANQLQDYASQQRKQPNVDWTQIAKQFTPPSNELQPAVAQFAQSLPYSDMPAYKAPGVVAEVPRSTVGYMPQEASPMFADLYGAPPVIQPQQMFAYAPETMTGVSGGVPSYEPMPQQAQVFKMPPIPIKGAVAPAQEEPSMAFAPRPPQSMADVMPFMTMPIETGQSLAMAEQPTVEQPKAEETPDEKQKRLAEESAKAWRQGNPFEVNINNTPYVIENYGIRPGVDVNNNQQDITIRNANTGKIFNIAVGSPNYNKVVEEYQNKIAQVFPTGENADYPHSVKVDNKWLPAKFVTDPNTGIKRLIYKDPDIGDAVYTNLSDLQYNPNNPENGTYRPPIVESGDPMDEFNQAQQSRVNWLEPKIKSLYTAAADVTTKAPLAEVKQNIVMISSQPLKAGEESLPGIDWGYKTQDGIIELSEAQKQGLVPAGTFEAIQESEKQLKSNNRSQVLGMSQYQQVEPEGIRDVELRNIAESIKLFNDELNGTGSFSGTTPPTPARIRELNRDIANLTRRRDAVLQSTSAVTSGPSGTTILSGGETKRAFALDPNTVQGALAILFGAGGKEDVTYQPTMQDYASLIIDQASRGLQQPKRLNVSGAYKSAIGSLASRLMYIEQDAHKEFGDNAYKVMDMPATFRYVDYETGSDKTYQGTLSKALDTFITADKAYKENPNNDTKTNLIEAAKPFSGTISIDGLGDYAASRSEITALSDASAMLLAAPVMDTSISGRTVAVSPEAEIKGAPVDITGGRTGTPRTATPSTSAVPLFYKGGGNPNDKVNYVKADAGFNLLERMNTSPATYVELVSSLTPNESANTGLKIMARAQLLDGGTIDTASIRASSQSVQDFNKKIVGNDQAAKDARQAFATIFYRSMNAIGVNSGYGGESAMFADLERIRNAAADPSKSESEVNKMITDFVWNYFGSPAAKSRYALSRIGQTIQQNYGTNMDYQGSSPINFGTSNGTSYLYDQSLEAGYDIARLWAESGLNRTSFKNNAYGPGSGRVVTWLVDPGIPEVNRKDNQSILTLPIANKRGTTVAPMTRTQADSLQGTGGAASLGTPVDPAINLAMINLSSIASNAIMMPIYTLFKQVSDPVINNARTNHSATGGNLFRGSTALRDADLDSNTTFDNTTKTAVSNLNAGANVLLSIFYPERNRKSRARMTPGSPWPIFKR